MKLWLVRHAQPLVEPGICYGRTDVRADALATAECAGQLAALLPTGLRVITSPLQRCAQLAHALHAQRPDLAYQTDARLQEMDFGHWEGQAWHALDRSELEAWTTSFADYHAGGDGESVTAFMARIASAFDALVDTNTDTGTVWITHAGVIRAMALLAQGIRSVAQASEWPLNAPKYGQWQLLDL